MPRQDKTIKFGDMFKDNGDDEVIIVTAVEKSSNASFNKTYKIYAVHSSNSYDSSNIQYYARRRIINGSYLLRSENWIKI